MMTLMMKMEFVNNSRKDASVFLLMSLTKLGMHFVIEGVVDSETSL